MAQSATDPIEQARQMGREVGPVDWEGFSQMKRWDHGILPDIRRLVGYDDPMGVGTYTHPPNPEAPHILTEAVDAFREGATEDLV